MLSEINKHRRANIVKFYLYEIRQSHREKTDWRFPEAGLGEEWGVIA